MLQTVFHPCNCWFEPKGVLLSTFEGSAFYLNSLSVLPLEADYPDKSDKKRLSCLVLQVLSNKNYQNLLTFDQLFNSFFAMI
jgi:hypothetical protein